MPTVEVLLPTPNRNDWVGRTRRAAIAGQAVALISNGWNSSDDFVVIVEHLLRDEYHASEVVLFRDPKVDERGNPAAKAPPEFLDAIVDAAPVALTMLGN
jgi:hypothetical protein